MLKIAIFEIYVKFVKVELNLAINTLFNNQYCGIFIEEL